MKVRRSVAVFALAALGAVSALGQFGVDPGDSFAKLGVGSIVKGDDGRRIALRVGDKYTLGASDTVYTVGSEVRSVPVGVGITLNGKDKATVVRQRSQQTVGVFPGTTFSVAGQLFDADANEFVGGTQSFVGTVLTLDSVSNLDNGRRFELGGFFFFPDNSDVNDLYQVAARYFPNKQIGFQVAYIDSSQFKASSASYHLLLDISTQGAGVTKGVTISSRLGVGALTNFTRDRDENGVSTRRNSTNFSTFVDVSLEITKRLSLNATEWFIRDRNNDINRFGIGLSYKL